MRTLPLLFIVLGLLQASILIAQDTPSHSDSTAVGSTMSSSEGAVWEQEGAYWKFLKADDRKKYLDLWDDRFVGWPRFEDAPIQKDRIARFMSERKLLDYKLEPLSVRQFGEDVVITLYRATIHTIDSNGANDNTRASRLTHTWMKTPNGWRIIGGMSADDNTSALSPPSRKQ
jgi:ketosteroid isomerase-like protein